MERPQLKTSFEQDKLLSPRFVMLSNLSKMVMEAGANVNQQVIRRNRPGTSAKVSVNES